MAHPGVDLVRTLLGDRATAIVPVEERRANLEALAGSVPAPPGVEVTELTVGGRPAERSVPVVVDGPGTVLYLHGGGYVSGSLGTHRGLAGRLALAAKRPVVSLDYRLAPEHPFPAAVDDTVATYRWLLDSGVLAKRIAVAGNSAGGGLALATLVALRDQDVALPVAAIALSAWTDLTASGSSVTTCAATDLMLTADGLRYSADLYAGPSRFDHPYASPLFADLHGLPPILLQASRAEILRDDTTRFAESARAQGIDVTEDLYDEMPHVWHMFAGVLPEADSALRSMGRWLATVAAQPPAP